MEIGMHPNEAFRLANCCLSNAQQQSITNPSQVSLKRVCSLWAGGQGAIWLLSVRTPDSRRITLSTAVKYIPASLTNGEEGELSYGDRRKAIAYQVETNFYQSVVPQLTQQCPTLRLIRPYHLERSSDNRRGPTILCLEWIDGGGFSPGHARDVVRWLATFHAQYWGHATVDRVVETANLHAQGSYWHLDTRPHEYDAMPTRGWEGRLKRAARAIHGCLQRDPMQCLIHGDVKDANVLLCPDGSVTMCDFQYTGKGSPTKDLAYFFCSSVEDLDRVEDELLQVYHEQLSDELVPEVHPTKSHLHASLAVAYCDFCRFMSGWGYWGNSLSGRVQAVLNELDGGKLLDTEQAYEEAIRRVFW